MVQRFDAIEVDIAKLRHYCLSDTHPRGRHKARVFRSRLGLDAKHAETLRRALVTAVEHGRSELRVTGTDEYGQRYSLDFSMTTDIGTTTIRSLWIVRTGETVLRLISCYVL